MRKLTQEELNIILDRHEKWVITHWKEGEQAIFKDLDLSNLCFSNRNLKNICFENCILNRASFEASNLKFALFVETECMFVEMGDVFAHHITFRKCNLTCAYITEAFLKRSSFYDCNMQQMEGDNTDFKQSKFINSDLSNSSFRNTILTDTEFVKTTIDHISF